MNRAEFFVYENSPLVGKTLEEIEKEYNVKVLEPDLFKHGRKYKYWDLEEKVEAGIMLAVKGKWENVGKAGIAACANKKEEEIK